MPDYYTDEAVDLIFNYLRACFMVTDEENLSPNQLCGKALLGLLEHDDMCDLLALDEHEVKREKVAAIMQDYHIPANVMIQAGVDSIKLRESISRRDRLELPPL